MFMESEVEKFSRRFSKTGQKSERFDRTDKSRREFRQELLLAKFPKLESR